MDADQKPTILLVEDDPGHARLIEKNLRRCRAANEIIVFSDGRRAIDYLFREGSFSNAGPLPPLVVLLDINLPALNGFQVLKTIKTDKRTRHIVVVMITTTENPLEVARCYRLGCNVYITKPVEYDQFTAVIHKFSSIMPLIKIV